MKNVNQSDDGQSNTSVINDGIGGLIDVGALIKVIFDNIRILSVLMTLSIVAACIYALILTPIYRSEVLLVAAENNEEALGSLMGGFSQIGSLFGSTGVAGGSIDNSIIGQEVIRSRDFLYSYIEKRDLLVPLLAAKEWDIGDATFEINEEIYDLKNNQWLAYQNPSSLKSPIYYEAFIILEPLISVAQDRKTGLIKVNFDHPTPQLASQWLKWLIDDLNDYFRKDDSQEAEASIQYLTQAIQDNPVKQVDLVLTSLIEKQLNTLMLTNSKSGYVYKILDTPYEPIQRISPRRTLIVIVLTAFSSIFFTFLILGLHWSGKKLTFTGIKNIN
ncbi:Wzz/FepE/Etk N-terminal domain-containing protein [Gammaproteobacteria bacterium]|nr:Wzz/FepE/Etk N-terminal domain-containing protein [Gammaproteobacteria bacterium]MDA9258787.1 Wzz/FepE/Etk N-terminal domain-containing protein [Gammaproteobacteria bacterium]